MTPEQTLERYRHIVVSNSDRKAHELDYFFRQLSENDQARHFFARRGVGSIWLYRDRRHPEYVLEIVYSQEHGDCISSLYKDCAENGSSGALLETREHLIKALSEKVGLSPEAMGIDDEARGRALAPHELGTGQLIDLLAEQFGSTIAIADQRSGNTGLMDKLLGRL